MTRSEDHRGSHRRALALALVTFVTTCAVIVLVQLAVIDDLSLFGVAVPVAIAAGASWMTYEFARGREPFGRA